MTAEITPALAQRHLDALTDIVARAAAATLATPAAAVERWTKPDQSPVTAADEASEAIIIAGLSKLMPGLPVIAEESIGQAPAGPLEPSFVLVDPLDGTKEFLAGRDDFTVNLAIVTHGVAITGIIAAPALGLLWRGVAGSKAERLRLRCDSGKAEVYGATVIRPRAATDQLIVAVSRSHRDAATDGLLVRLPVGERIVRGSSIKFCYVAQGDVDLYPRLSPTHEWDIAAGCAIIAAAGGQVSDPQGGPLRFGDRTKKFVVPGFLAWGDPARANRKI